MKPRSAVLVALLFILSLFVISACGGSEGEGSQEWTLAPESALPDFARSAPPQVQEAYRFAIANPEVLEAFPCYCGCGQMGHQNNLGCYIKETGAVGTLVFENHAFG